jgi:SlyX protein
MNGDALEQLQTKIAYLERANADLSDMVFRQHQEIKALEHKLKELTQRLNAAVSAWSEQEPADQRPPHY